MVLDDRLLFLGPVVTLLIVHLALLNYYSSCSIRRHIKSMLPFVDEEPVEENIQTSLGIWPYVKRDRYPRRVNMSECEPRYGKIGIFVVIDANVTGKYGVALRSLECYVKSTPYEYFLVDMGTDADVLEHCANYTYLFRKQCAAAVYLRRVDWLVILDADTGVVNPNHCIEEYIDSRVNLIFYERAFDWEVAAGNTIVKNGEMGYNFLMELAKAQKHNYFGHDQGPLPARDSYFNEDNWNDDVDFMIHNWKENNISEKWKSPFKTILEPDKCGRNLDGWNWRPEKQVNIERLKAQLRKFESKQQAWYPKIARGLTYLEIPDIGECWPKCEDYED